MELNVTGAFIYFTIPIFGGIPITQTTVSSFVVALILIIASICLGRNLKKRPDGVQVLVEKGVSMLYNMVGESMGEHNLHWAPFIGTIFLSSLCGSFIGLTGFLRSSTADHLVQRHQKQRFCRLAQGLYGTDCGDDAHEYHQ